MSGGWQQGHKPGFGGFFGKESTASADVYLNLTPLMDVMSNILFFLLSAFGASLVAVMPVTVPVQSTTESAVETMDDKVTVTVKADAFGFAVACASQTAPPEKLRPYAVKLPKRASAYDKDGLRTALVRIKEAFPGSATMILVPDDSLKYDTIVQIMDAARSVTLPGGRLVTLFPEGVLSSIYTGEPA
ncbi:MAG: biopolymer transporter ExbD, partial [Myxococcota bacterium]